jgi:hypothetical protein
MQKRVTEVRSITTLSRSVMFVEYDKVKTRFRNEGWQTMCVALYSNLDGCVGF